MTKHHLTTVGEIKMATLTVSRIHRPWSLVALVRSDGTVSESNGKTGKAKRSESHFDGRDAGS